MPLDLGPFFADTVERLQAPIEVYFEAVGTEDSASPRSQRALVNCREAFKRAVSDALNAAGVIGGDGDMTTAARDALNDLKAEQFDFIAGFMADLPSETEAYALARAALYATAIIQAISKIAVISLPELPYTPGCEQLDCTWHCHCHLEVVRLMGEGNYDVLWVMDPEAEHCESCLELSRKWKPLQIREGKLTGDYELSTKAVARAHALHTLFDAAAVAL